jgi:hypothetical protein
MRIRTLNYTRVTNQKINFLSKGLKIPSIRDLKKPACAFKREVLERLLELAILRYVTCIVMRQKVSLGLSKFS